MVDDLRPAWKTDAELRQVESPRDCARTAAFRAMMHALGPDRYFALRDNFGSYSIRRMIDEMLAEADRAYLIALRARHEDNA